jgi:hypothetical protein
MLAPLGFLAFVGTPPARAAMALCTAHGKRGSKKLSLPVLLMCGFAIFIVL